MSTEMARGLCVLAVGGSFSFQVYASIRWGTRLSGTLDSRGGGILPAIVVMVLLVSLLFGVGGELGQRPGAV